MNTTLAMLAHIPERVWNLWMWPYQREIGVAVAVDGLIEEIGMSTTTFRVAGMSCGGCVRKVTGELADTTTTAPTRSEKGVPVVRSSDTAALNRG